MSRERSTDEAQSRSRRDAMPGVARVAATAGMRTIGWYTGTALRAGRRLTEAAIAGESPIELAREARGELIDGARRALGVTDLEQRIGLLGPPRERSDPDGAGSLRRRGEALLERSAALEAGSEAHPAFDRILGQLSPDEARILSLLASEGPQAAVDVRTWRPFGIGSTAVAPGLTMIGRHAGCIRVERVPAYLANLHRLGLLWFSRDPVPRAISRYQVLESQPEVLEARRAAGRAQVVRRSIRLTAFGEQFCALCLPSERRPGASA